MIEPRELEELQSKIGRKFETPCLLALALTHRSCRREVRKRVVVQCNERLEFLGDGLLEAAIRSYLYRQYPLESEHIMTQLEARLENNQFLGSVAEEFGLTDFVILSDAAATQYASEHEVRRKILANTFEAVIGALFIDGGFVAVESFLELTLFPRVEAIKVSLNEAVISANSSKLVANAQE